MYSNYFRCGEGRSVIGGNLLYAFDADGVCAHLVPKVLKELKEHFGDSVPLYENVIDENFLDKPSKVFTPEHQKFARNLLRQDGFVSDLAIIDGSRETIDHLRRNGHTVVWVTKPSYTSKTWCFDRMLWLKANFAATEGDVYFCTNKSRIPADYFVDDKPEHVEAWLTRWKGENKNCQGFLFPQPWNKESKLPTITWDEIRKTA